MESFYNYPSEEEPVNDKKCPHKISTLTSTNSVTMEVIEHILQKMFQEKNQK